MADRPVRVVLEVMVDASDPKLCCTCPGLVWAYGDKRAEARACAVFRTHHGALMLNMTERNGEAATVTSSSTPT